MHNITKTISEITKINYEFIKIAQNKLDNLTKPQGSLGRLEELAKLIVCITEKENPQIKNKVIFTLAGDHGVAKEKVSAYPQEVTAQMVYNFMQGGAAINVLAKHIGAKVVIADLGVASKIKKSPPISNGCPKIQNCKFIDKKINLGTKNFAQGSAMSKLEAIKSINAGIEIFNNEFKNGIDIIGIGEMGIANTTPASAITACLTKSSVSSVTGKGTGIDDKGLKNKIKVINKALKINKPDATNPLDVLEKVGGFEIGGLVGIILAAASKKVPVVIDGFISTSAALLAYHFKPEVKDYLIASHCSAEKGHKIILKYVGLKPLLNLDLRLGEGTGAALGINLVECAVKILTQMATFKSAGVSERTN